MTDTMPSGESKSDPDDEASDPGSDTREPAPEEASDASGSTAGASGGDHDGGEPDQSDAELAKVAGSDPPDPRKLDQLDEQIRHARSTAEDVVGTEEQPIYTESGEEDSADDQAITPPG